MANPFVSSYISGLRCRGTDLERVTLAQIAEIEFFTLSLGVRLRAALDEFIQ